MASTAPPTAPSTAPSTASSSATTVRQAINPLVAFIPIVAILIIIGIVLLLYKTRRLWLASFITTDPAYKSTYYNYDKGTTGLPHYAPSNHGMATEKLLKSQRSDKPVISRESQKFKPFQNQSKAYTPDPKKETKPGRESKTKKEKSPSKPLKNKEKVPSKSSVIESNVDKVESDEELLHSEPSDPQIAIADEKNENE